MKCHYCGNADSIYVCDLHEKKMLTTDDLKNTCSGSYNTIYRNKYDEPLYDIQDLRKSYTYKIFENEPINSETLDEFFRLKNTIEVIYHKKIIREKRKYAIQNLANQCVKKLDMNYFDEFKPHFENLIEQHTDVKYITPVECALQIYKFFETYINNENAKKTRIELAINCIENISLTAKNMFMKGSAYQRFIHGSITYDDFEKEIMRCVGISDRIELLNDALDKYISKEYHKLCRQTQSANNYILFGNNYEIESLINLFNVTIKKHAVRVKKGLRNTDKFFDNY